MLTAVVTLYDLSAMDTPTADTSIAIVLPDRPTGDVMPETVAAILKNFGASKAQPVYPGAPELNRRRIFQTTVNCTDGGERLMEALFDDANVVLTFVLDTPQAPDAAGPGHELA